MEYIGTEEQQEDPEEIEEGEEEEPYGVFDEEFPEGEENQEEDDSYRVITQTFDGTVIPEGAIPDNAMDVQITTTTEPVVEE